MTHEDFHIIAKKAVACALFDYSKTVESETDRIEHSGGGWPRFQAEQKAMLNLIPEILIAAIENALEEYHNSLSSGR